MLNACCYHSEVIKGAYVIENFLMSSPLSRKIHDQNVALLLRTGQDRTFDTTLIKVLFLQTNQLNVAESFLIGL